jgi:hypothetical protein
MQKKCPLRNIGENNRDIGFQNLKWNETKWDTAPISGYFVTLAFSKPRKISFMVNERRQTSWTIPFPKNGSKIT